MASRTNSDPNFEQTPDEFNIMEEEFYEENDMNHFIDKDVNANKDDDNAPLPSVLTVDHSTSWRISIVVFTILWSTKIYT